MIGKFCPSFAVKRMTITALNRNVFILRWSKEKKMLISFRFSKERKQDVWCFHRPSVLSALWREWKMTLYTSHLTSKSIIGWSKPFCAGQALNFLRRRKNCPDVASCELITPGLLPKKKIFYFSACKSCDQRGWRELGSDCETLILVQMHEISGI